MFQPRTYRALIDNGRLTAFTVTVRDINRAIEFGKGISGVTEPAIVVGDQLGVWGAVGIVSLGRKRG